MIYFRVPIVDVYPFWAIDDVDGLIILEITVDMLNGLFRNNIVVVGETE